MVYPAMVSFTAVYSRGSVDPSLPCQSRTGRVVISRLPQPEANREERCRDEEGEGEGEGDAAGAAMSIETPAFMLPTKLGSPVALTPDLLEKIPHEPIAQASLSQADKCRTGMCGDG